MLLVGLGEVTCNMEEEGSVPVVVMKTENISQVSV